MKRTVLIDHNKTRYFQVTTDGIMYMCFDELTGTDICIFTGASTHFSFDAEYKGVKTTEMYTVEFKTMFYRAAKRHPVYFKARYLSKKKQLAIKLQYPEVFL